MHKTLKTELELERAATNAANAHCTVVPAELKVVLIHLKNTQWEKAQGSIKVKAHFVTHPDLEEALDAEEMEQLEKEQVEAKKEAQKIADINAQNICIAHNSTLKVYDLPLSSLKKKEFKALAIVLGS
ncbi:hypothetical protein C0993_002774 [Termitomyces sp. T159_Od127]|nr:hypothetical protein C0993_002774 [Termitomyces sp. T159_Od127]